MMYSKEEDILKQINELYKENLNGKISQTSIK